MLTGWIIESNAGKISCYRSKPLIEQDYFFLIIISPSLRGRTIFSTR